MLPYSNSWKASFPTNFSGFNSKTTGNKKRKLFSELNLSHLNLNSNRKSRNKAQTSTGKSLKYTPKLPTKWASKVTPFSNSSHNQPFLISSPLRPKHHSPTIGRKEKVVSITLTMRILNKVNFKANLNTICLSGRLSAVFTKSPPEKSVWDRKTPSLESSKPLPWSRKGKEISRKS